MKGYFEGYDFGPEDISFPKSFMVGRHIITNWDDGSSRLIWFPTLEQYDFGFNIPDNVTEDKLKLYTLFS